jgi:hypothetical protein
MTQPYYLSNAQRENMAVDIETIARQIRVLNKTWWEDPITNKPIERNVGEMLMLVVTELSEALEGHRKGLMDDKLPNYKMFDVEIVDALIRLFDIAGNLIPDIGYIFTAKLVYNTHREDHKPENRIKNGGKKY